MNVLKLAMLPFVFLVVFTIVSLGVRGVQRRRYTLGRPSGYSYSIHRSGLSSQRMSVLFPTGAALRGIYIASQMRPRVRLNSYRDLHGYTVCEGRKLYRDSLGVTNYKYFLCPDNINQPFERYCCVDDNGMGVCCSYDQRSNHFMLRSGTVIGSVVGFLIFIAVVGILVYFCCYRNRFSRKTPTATAVIVTPATGIPGVSGYDQTSAGQHQADVPPYPGDYVPPYPDQPQMPTPMPKESVLPYPTANQPSLQPQAPWGAGVPTISSGWGAPDSSASAVPNSGYASQPPPPPYSAAVGTTPYPST